MSHSRLLLLVAAGALTFAACGDNSTGGATATVPSTDAMTESTDSMTDSTDAMTDLPAWQKLTLTDVDGEAFTLGDFMGKPVFVENFATWCPNCKKQLGTTQQAAAELGDDAVFIALSVETDLSSSDVAEYAADNGFTNIRFAVMTPEFLAAISDAYGNSSINPPSTPHFIIDTHSEAGELTTGFEDAASIVDALHAAAM